MLQTGIQDEHDRDYAITFRNTVSVLVHRATGYFFRFEKYRSKYSPGHQLRTRIESWNRLIDRDDHLHDWLFNLKTETEDLIRAERRGRGRVEDNPLSMSSGGPNQDSIPRSILAPESRNPRAFVSFGTQDRPFVERFAGDLRKYGVDAWCAVWEIQPGDSIPSKINEGLEQCEFFVIVLSRSSITRPWVQTELEAAIGRKVAGKIRKIIPIKVDDCGDIPVTISSLCWEDFSSEDYDCAFKRVLNSIFEVDVRPPLGRFNNLLPPNVPRGEQA